MAGNHATKAPEKRGGHGNHRENPAAPAGGLAAAIRRERNPFKRFLRILGPGLITGASDDDPSGIGTYAVAGASLGFGVLWTALLTYPLMATIQYICAVIARVFKWLTLALLAYTGSSIFSRPDLLEVVKGTLLPRLQFNGAFLTILVAILGTTISPYLFFWQASEEVDEEIGMGRTRLWQRRGASDAELKYAALDVNTGMAFSNIVMYFIILGTAATLYASGKRDIKSATDAAEALRPLAGNAAALLLAAGLIGSGFLAVPILTGSAAYALSEAFGWSYGLGKKLTHAKQFYSVIAASTLVGILINFIGINPIKALFWTAVINGFLAPPLMVLIMLIANNRRIMGARVNCRSVNLLGWAVTATMFAAAIGLVVTWL